MRRSAGRKVRETWVNPTSSEFPTEEQADGVILNVLPSTRSSAG
jgi:hypothetical protein